MRFEIFRCWQVSIQKVQLPLSMSTAGKQRWCFLRSLRPLQSGLHFIYAWHIAGDQLIAAA